MIHKIKIGVIFLITVLIGGCDDNFLETVPTDRISSAIYWQTDQDAEFAANAIYQYLINEDVARFLEWDGMSDIAHISLTWRQNAQISLNAYDASHLGVENEWEYDFKGIQAANRFLENVSRIEAADPDLVAQYAAEVKVLRAFLYTKMAMLWGDLPLFTREITLEESRTVSRTPVAQVWDFISTDLAEAAVDLPNTTTQVGRITKGTALALKARANLFAGRWSDAAAAAKAVMDLSVYSLYPSYQDLFTYPAQNSSESILSRQYVANIQSHTLYTLLSPISISNVTNSSGIVPTKEFVDAFEMTNGKAIDDPTSGFDPFDPYTNRDPRLRYSTFLLGDILPDGSTYDPRPGSGTLDQVGSTQDATATGFNVRKYFNYSDRNNPSNGGINIMLIRYAEVLLTYAEAKIEANDIDQSTIDAINEVRQRADVNMPPIAMGAQADMRKIVRNERLVELAFEGLRYFDIRRWKTAETVLPGPINGMTYVDGNGDLQTVIDASFVRDFNPSRDYLWPIPNTEVQLNENLGQNPNW